MLPEIDYYAQSAEMYDVLSEAHWASRRDSVRNALQRLGVSNGIILDIGAGTGSCVQLIGETLPDVEIYAIEPSTSMRIGLMTRLLMLPDLRRRTTVCAQAFQSAILPKQFAAVVACGCIGYFDREERRDLWQRLAKGLGKGGTVLSDVMTLEQPRPFAEARVASSMVGKLRYDIWLSGTPLKDDLMQWHMRFEVHDGTEIVRSFSIEREWHAFSLEQLVQEATEFGFRAEKLVESAVPAAILRLED